MKKFLILFLLLLITLSFTVGCQEKEIDNDYVNEKYGFTFRVPSNWENKYKVIEDDKRISFVYSQYKYEDGNFQEFFTIAIMSKDEYEKALNEPPMTGELLAEKDEQVYVLYTPLDVGIMNSKKAEEYMKLNLSRDEKKERFYLNE